MSTEISRDGNATGPAALHVVDMDVPGGPTISRTLHKQGYPSAVLSAGLIVALSAAVSAFWLLVFYPGVMTYDALLHWWQQALDNRYGLWHPPLLAMLLHLTQYFTDQPDLFSFVQGAFFWAGLLFLLRQASPSMPWFAAGSVLVLLVPSIWLYANAVSSNAWMAGSLLFSTSCLIDTVRRREPRSFWLAVLCFSGAVAFRREALILLPVFLFMFHRYIRNPDKRMKSVGGILVIIVISVLPAQFIELAPVVEPSPHAPAGHGLLNQYVGIIKRVKGELGGPALDSERSEIDAVFGNGTFDRLLARYQCRTADYISVWPGSVLGEGIRKKDMMFVFRKVATAAARHPRAFIAHNLCYYRSLLHADKVVYRDLGVMRSNALIRFLRKRYDMEFNSKLPMVRDWYVRVIDTFLSRPLLSWTFSHFWLLLGAGAVGVAGVRTRRPELWVPALLGLAYPLGYFLFGPNGNWRYLFFSHVCGWVSLIVGTQYAATGLSGRLRRSRG